MNRTMTRAAVNILMVLVLAGGVAPLAHAAGPWQQAPAGQSEFVPVSELPQAEQLPAAPLLIADA